MTILSTSEQEYDVSSTEGTILIPRGVLRGGANAIDSTYQGVDVANYGDIYGSNSGIFMDSEADSSARIYNAAGANINSFRTGIYISENDDSIYNSGSINSANAIYVSVASGTLISNNGAISGQLVGIGFNFCSDFAIVNSGSVIAHNNGIEASLGSNTASSIFNSGVVAGNDYALYVSGDNSGVLNIHNSGTLDGNVFAGNQTTNFYNSGNINGTVQLGSGQDTFKNFGTINGDLDLYSLAGGNLQTVISRGAIKGDVNLGSGGGTFYGRKGSVDGTITGGAGADTIVAGDDGEAMAGGKGHDILYGGGGADTFAFASGAASDTDVVHGFSVANDTIQLAHSAYSHLVAGQTPTFAIGSAATTSTDYLFYNSGTGGLYYDSNGSAASGAYLIATLDKGLALTANNFSVV